MFVFLLSHLARVHDSTAATTTAPTPGLRAHVLTAGATWLVQTGWCSLAGATWLVQPGSCSRPAWRTLGSGVRSVAAAFNLTTQTLRCFARSPGFLVFASLLFEAAYVEMAELFGDVDGHGVSIDSLPIMTPTPDSVGSRFRRHGSLNNGTNRIPGPRS